MSIGVNTLGSNNSIERFEGLCGKEDSRSEPPDVVRKVDEYMKFGLIEPTVGPPRCTQKEMFDLMS